MTTSTESPGSSESFQIPLEAAELYESAFVPAFFAQWAPMLCDVAGVAPGQHVLDVACGTGVVARAAAERMGDGGRVAGVDLNEAMLTVARRAGATIDWRQGDVAALPFPDAAFDAVLCQMALMFFPDQPLAIREMARVARAGGTVAVAVPAGLDAQEAFAPFVAMAARLAGDEAAALLTSYFVCGDLDALQASIEAAGLHVTATRTVVGTYGAPSVDAAVATEVESTPLVERMSAATYEELRQRAREVFAPWTAADGRLAAPFATHLVAARRD